MNSIEELINYLETKIESEKRFALMGDSSSKVLVDEYMKIMEYLKQIMDKHYMKY